MRVFTYSEARQKLSTVLDLARREEVVIARRGGENFCLTYKTEPKSPFDVPAIKTKATTRDILAAVKASRAREPGPVSHRGGHARAHKLGVLPGVKLDNIQELLAQIEGENHR